MLDILADHLREKGYYIIVAEDIHQADMLIIGLFDELGQFTHRSIINFDEATCKLSAKLCFDDPNYSNYFQKIQCESL